METRSGILAGKIKWRSLAGYSPWGCRVGYDCAHKHCQARVCNFPERFFSAGDRFGPAPPSSKLLLRLSSRPGFPADRGSRATARPEQLGFLSGPRASPAPAAGRGHRRGARGGGGDLWPHNGRGGPVLARLPL